MLKFRYIFLFILACNFSGYAQTVKSKSVQVEFNHILDNREYFSSYAKHQTLLGASANVMLQATLGDEHAVYGGLYYLYEYGHLLGGHKPIINLFYEYKSENLEFYTGSFPRKNKLNYPLALLTDTLLYYRPNIQGGIGTIKWDWGKQSFWCDWTSRQSDSVKETFMAGFSGEVKRGMVYFEHYAYMYHRAHKAIKDTSDHIRDNGGGCAFIGLDVSEHLPLQTLKADVGFLLSYDRTRPDPYGFYKGIMFRAKASIKKFGLDVSYYKGDKIDLAYGDRFYRSGNYGRVDLVWWPYKSDNIITEFKLGAHKTPERLDFSQQFFITVNFEAFKKKEVN